MFDEKIKYWLWLTMIPYVGCVARWRLLKHFRTPEQVYAADSVALEATGILNARQLPSILSCRSLDKALRVQEACEQLGIEVLTLTDARYPQRAQVSRQVPILLYYKGKLNNDAMAKTVGIVGARRCTQEDKAKVIEITKNYVASGYAVVSGMAKGVDSYAHTVCLQDGGYTVAVLGNGLDICYPKEHEKLMARIGEQGLLLSEYPPGTEPARHNFPDRNRIIAGWSDELEVIGAGHKSGALITYDEWRLVNGARMDGCTEGML